MQERKFDLEKIVVPILVLLFLLVFHWNQKPISFQTTILSTYRKQPEETFNEKKTSFSGKKCVFFGKNTNKNFLVFSYRSAIGRESNDFLTENCSSLVDCSLWNCWCKARMVLAEFREFHIRRKSMVSEFLYSTVSSWYWNRMFLKLLPEKLLQVENSRKTVCWKILL